MEPVVGFEPTTDGLQNRCSTTELNWLGDRVAPVLSLKRTRRQTILKGHVYFLRFRLMGRRSGFAAKKISRATEINRKRQRMAATVIAVTCRFVRFVTN